VLFSVPSMKDYGQLSKRPLDEMIAGARVEVAPYKKDPRDFVLWKPSKPGEPSWPPPAGVKTLGRPGWHIECSAMAWKYLGEMFDIHGGGIDLVFPHHEDEIAQSRCAFHTPVMANYWMHNGFLQVEGEKMSKSLGNFVTINELLNTANFGGRKWPGEIVRLAMLMTHYQQPVDWTVTRLQEASVRQGRWLGPSVQRGVPEKGQVSKAVLDALANDLSTSDVFMVLDDLANRARAAGTTNPADVANDLAASMLWLGIVRDEEFDEARANSEDIRDAIKAARAGLDKEAILQRIEARNAARKAKDWKESDRIRDELADMGVVLKDSKDGTTWEIAR
jgi:cysteinyl-tRNA synthetase